MKKLCCIFHFLTSNRHMNQYLISNISIIDVRCQLAVTLGYIETVLRIHVDECLCRCLSLNFWSSDLSIVFSYCLTVFISHQIFNVVSNIKIVISIYHNVWDFSTSQLCYTSPWISLDNKCHLHGNQPKIYFHFSAVPAKPSHYSSGICAITLLYCLPCINGVKWMSAVLRVTVTINKVLSYLITASAALGDCAVCEHHVSEQLCWV